MPDIPFLFSFFFYIPLLLLISILLIRKGKLSVKEITIKLLVAVIITITTGYIVKGEYSFFVGGPSGIAHGYPYYHKFTDLQVFPITLPGNEKESAKPVPIDNDQSIGHASVLITSMINFWFNVVFWFFVSSVGYFVYKKIR